MADPKVKMETGSDTHWASSEVSFSKISKTDILNIRETSVHLDHEVVCLRGSKDILLATDTPAMCAPTCLPLSP